MSDRYNEFDQLFRDRLRDQSATPPDSVWNNIQAERSFGHIVTNKISSTWRIIGTLLLLAIAGGTSAFLMNSSTDTLAPENENRMVANQQAAIVETPSVNKNQTLKPSFALQEFISSKEIPTSHTNNLNQEEEIVLNKPHSDLLASNSNMGFGKPDFGNTKLAVLIDEMDGWGTAKPSSHIRFYHLGKLNKKSMEGPILVKSPFLPEAQWDYVIESAPRKTFKDRVTLHFYLGPQFINKILTPEYNMETSFLEKRLETENTRLAYTIGVNLQYDLKNHKFFESGIQFTQIYEEVRIDGDMRFSNQYDFVEIPLLIGYQDRESKWGWSVKGGLGVQVYNNYKGYILKKVEDRISAPLAEPQTPEPNAEYRISGSNVVKNIVNNDHTLSHKQDRNEVYDLSSDENPYKSSGIINIHMAAGVTYFHSINTSFSVTPYYRQSINSLTKTEANFSERISYMGVLFGTNVKF